jgi:hypothetical protein
MQTSSSPSALNYRYPYISPIADRSGEWRFIAQKRTEAAAAAINANGQFATFDGRFLPLTLGGLIGGRWRIAFAHLATGVVHKIEAY